MPDGNRHYPSLDLELALDRHWDAILAGGEPPDAEIDPGLAATVRRVHALDAAAGPRPAFAATLWADLTHAQTAPPGPSATPDPSLPIRPASFQAWRPWRMPVSSLSQLAAAILIIALLAGSALVALYPLRPQHDDGLPLYAPLGAPAASVLEFLWESKGGPDPFSEAYGIGIAPDGNIWVADGENDRIQILAPDGTFRETWGAAGSGDGQFNFDSPDSKYTYNYGDVAFDAAGNFYVVDAGNYRVQKFAPDRSFLLAWGSRGMGDGQFLVPGGIAVGPNGEVYVSDENRGAVQMFSADGAYLGTIGKAGAGDGKFLTAAGVATDGEGNVWVTDFTSNRIQRFSATGEFLGAWGRSGSADGQLSSPNDVAVDRLGHVYVVDTGNNRLQVFAPDGRFLARIGGRLSGETPGTFFQPSGIAVAANGTIYVSDTYRVQAFQLILPAGDQLTMTTNRDAIPATVIPAPTSAATVRAAGTLDFLWDAASPYPLADPYGLGIDPQGNLWVSDGGNDRFQIFAPDGTFLETWGSSGAQEGQFDLRAKGSYILGDVAFDAAGNIYVVDSGNSRVQKFAPDRTFLLAWGGQGKEDGQFLAPGGIAISADGTIYVSDERRADVQMFDGDGRFLGAIGEFGIRDEQFNVPAGVTVDLEGNAWVADFGKHRIQRFNADGDVLASWGKFGSRAGELHSPNDVAVDRLGRVYVADTNNARLQVFAADGRFLAQIGGFGAGPGQFRDPAGVAVDAAGTVYVSSKHRVQAFRLIMPTGAELRP